MVSIELISTENQDGNQDQSATNQSINQAKEKEDEGREGDEGGRRMTTIK